MYVTNNKEPWTLNKTMKKKPFNAFEIIATHKKMCTGVFT